MVVTLAPSACTASVVQAFTAMPSMSPVQAPHWLVSQPILVPVRPASRRKWTRRRRGHLLLIWATVDVVDMGDR
jgi:hypothetical protein